MGALDPDLLPHEQIERETEEYFERFLRTGGRATPEQLADLAERCDVIARLHENEADAFRRRAERFRTTDH
jgi:hypothetical protein